MSNKTLSERIAEERIDKSTAQPRTIKQMARNPQSLNFSLAIQRNLRWSDAAKSALIESILLGYPIPPVYALRSEDKSAWLLDGKQRLSTLISFYNNEFELTELDPVYGVDISGMKFDNLPEEFQELISDHNIVFYQFEKLTTEQRDSLFVRLNSGVSLSNVELVRGVLGSDILDWMNELIKTPFFGMMNMSIVQRDKFVDQETILQMIAITQGKYDIGGKNLQEIALNLRVNGFDEELKQKVYNVVEYLGEAFTGYDEKEQKKLLRKNDVIGLYGCALEVMGDIPAEKFGGWSPNLILSPSGAYKASKGSGSAKGDKVKKRISLLVECVNKYAAESGLKTCDRQLELVV